MSQPSAYFSLNKRLQQAIVHELGWRQLRPVQEAAIPPLLAGDDSVILAPTAGGKTESALFPLLSKVAHERGPNILYLCPLKALINNLLPRLQRLSRMVGREAFAWHGEVTAGARKDFLENPRCILLTTPESLQVLLSKRDLEPSKIFANLQAVVIDEVHAFCGEDRGDQLLALLAGLDHWTDRVVQRVGLSATVGNPEHLLRWLSDERGSRTSLVDPTSMGKKPRRKIEVQPVGEDLVECADLLARMIHRVPKSLLFVDSRRQAEQIRHLLAERGVDALAHHSSLSQELREQSEAAFKSERAARKTAQAIVCTSTLELGLDVGDIDQVFQLGAPSTVSAFLQRFGRAGRRADSVGHMTFVTDEAESFLRSLALIRLAVAKKVEPVLPTRRALEVFVQQTLLHIVRDGGIAPDTLHKRLGKPWCFSGISAAEREEILEHLQEDGWVFKSGGRLLLTERTEKEYGRSHFMELLSVFSGGSSAIVKTLDGRQVGSVDGGVARELWAEKASFLLGGSSWKVRGFDPRQAILTVVPSVGGKTLRWNGVKGTTSFALTREIRAILTETEPLAFLGPRAGDTLDALRAEYRYLDGERPVAWEAGKNLVVETWAGDSINATIAAAFSALLGTTGNSNARSFTLQAGFGEFSRSGPVSKDLLISGLELYQRTSAPVDGKFTPLLPEHLRRELEREQHYDIEGALSVALESVDSLMLQSAPGGR